MLWVRLKVLPGSRFAFSAAWWCRCWGGWSHCGGWGMGLECCCFSRVCGCIVLSATNQSHLYQKEGNVYKQTGGGEESISLFAVYTMSCFFFALIHGIYSLNLSTVICVVTEPAVVIYYIHKSHASHVSEYHFNWKCFLTILRLYLLLSRSEANDLALRLARQYRGHQDMITLEK